MDCLKSSFHILWIPFCVELLMWNLLSYTFFWCSVRIWVHLTVEIKIWFPCCLWQFYSFRPLIFIRNLTILWKIEIYVLFKRWIWRRVLNIRSHLFKICCFGVSIKWWLRVGRKLLYISKRRHILDFLLFEQRCMMTLTINYATLHISLLDIIYVFQPYLLCRGPSSILL